MSRVSGIIDQLQQAKDQKLLVTEIFPNDLETDNSINQIAHRVRERLGGRHLLKVKDGVWSLTGYAKTITGEEMNQNEMLARLERLDNKLNKILWVSLIFAIIVIVFVLVVWLSFNFEYQSYG